MIETVSWPVLNAGVRRSSKEPMSIHKQQQRVAWFEQGARAIELVSSGRLRRVYVCPLCVTAFPREALDTGVLTLEHAPPRALGGRAVVLTCRACNSRAGHELDSDMQTAEQVMDFVLGTMSEPVRVQLQMEGRSVNAEMLAAGGNLQIVGIPRCNDPRAQSNLIAALNKLVDEGGWEGREFHITFLNKHSPRHASLGWLRSAYLVAFAALGYSYILRPELRVVRKQLADTSARYLDVFSWLMPDATASERRTILVETPQYLRSIAVQMGRHVVFLPGLEDDPDLYKRLAQRNSAERVSAKGFREAIKGKALSWPTSPMFALDFFKTDAAC